MLKSKLLDAIQKEIYRHDFGTYVDNPPSVAQGGKGVVVAGCPACKKRLQSMNGISQPSGERRDAVFIGPARGLIHSQGLAVLLGAALTA